MGDLNAKVGQYRKGNIVGPCGMGEKNERGEKLIEFCQSRKLTITNTWFTLPNRRKYTWISPDGKTRSQIDYIMINTLFRNSVKQTKTYPGADIGSDHNPIVATVKNNLKRIKKKENIEQFNLDMLKDEQMRQQYAVEVNNIFDCHLHEVTEQGYERDRVDILWTNIKEGIQKAAHNILSKIVKKNKKPCIRTDILDMMEKRKRAKNTQRYEETNRQVKRACKIAKENWLAEQCQEIENLEKQQGKCMTRYGG